MTNMKKLAILKMSVDAVPKGGGLDSAIEFLMDPKLISEGAKKADKFVLAAVQAVRSAADPNPYKHADDETIAGHLLKEAYKKLGRCEKGGGPLTCTRLKGRVCFRCAQ